jgi:anaerobic magnesium-protoporphyrin IX monomethyl ester cyclase
LAAVLHQEEHSVTIMNCIKEQMTYDGFYKHISREKYDVIGFQMFSYDLNSVKKHLKIVREILPSSVTVAGGPHPSGDPEGTLLSLEQLDFAFQGEAEIGLPKLLQALNGGDVTLDIIPGLIWREGITIRTNPPFFVENLDSLPMPFWELLRPENYPEAPHGAFTKAFPTAPIIITRGCSMGCSFCAGRRINGDKIRRRSLDSVMTELNHLAGRGIKEFHIEDENFTESADFVLDFCDRLNSENLGMSWSLPSGVRLGTLTRQVIIAMAGAGCYSLAVGIEFGSDRMLRVTGKGMTVDLIRSKLHLFNGIDIKITGFFLFGIPGETCDEMEETIRFALELPVDRAQFNNFMPLPGSIEWDKLKKAGHLEDVNWDRLFVHDVSYTDGSVSSAKLKWIQRSAVLRFYCRPLILLGVMREIRSFRHFVYLMKRLADTLK